LPARAKFSSLMYPESASTVRSLGRIPAAANWSRHWPGSVRFAFCAALPASLVPSRLSRPSDTMPSAASNRSTSAQRLLVPGPEPGDSGVIGVQAARDHPVGHIPHAPLLDHRLDRSP
jgi:hypothetical protein